MVDAVRQSCNSAGITCSYSVQKKTTDQPWAALGGWQGGQLPPVPSYLPPSAASPLVRLMTLGALQGFSIFFVKKQLNVLKFLV